MFVFAIITTAPRHGVAQWYDTNFVMNDNVFYLNCALDRSESACPS